MEDSWAGCYSSRQRIIRLRLMLWKMIRNAPQPTCAIILCREISATIDDVYKFGKGLDALTIEIESVNIEALEKLGSGGCQKFSRVPQRCGLLRTKSLQKDFLREPGDSHGGIHRFFKNKHELQQQSGLSSRSTEAWRKAAMMDGSGDH